MQNVELSIINVVESVSSMYKGQAEKNTDWAESKKIKGGSGDK